MIANPIFHNNTRWYYLLAFPIALEHIMTEWRSQVSSEMSQGIINLTPQPILAVVQLRNRFSSFYHSLKYTPLSRS